MQKNWDGLGNCSDCLGNIDNAWQGMVHQCTLHKWMWERYTMYMIRKAKHKNRKRHLPKLGQESNVYSASRLWTLRTWRVFSLLTLHFMRECTFPWPSLSISTALMLIFCLYLPPLPKLSLSFSGVLCFRSYTTTKPPSCDSHSAAKLPLEPILSFRSTGKPLHSDWARFGHNL